MRDASQLRGGASPSLIALAVILGVGDVRAPVRRAFGDGQMAHEVVGPGTVPVFLAVGREDDVARIELDDLLPAGLDQAASFRDVEGLPSFVAVPGTASSGREMNRRSVQLRGRQATGDRVYEHLASEGRCGSSAVAASRDISMASLLRSCGTTPVQSAD